MPVRLPDLSYCHKKIIDQCSGGRHQPAVALRHKLSAIAFSKNGTIIASAVNKRIITSFHIVDKYTIHAEEALVQKLWNVKARERFKEIYILVSRCRREFKKWIWDMAKPCPDCEHLLSQYGVDGVFYTSENGDIAQLF